MKCPKCGYRIPKPTTKEIEAYRLIHIHGCSHKEAGLMLGVDRSTITKRMASLRTKDAALFVAPFKRVNHKKTLRFDETMTCKIKTTF